MRADFDTTNGAFTLVQGPRPDALRLPDSTPSILLHQILDIGWVPASRTAQWTLTNSPASRFFRLELEPAHGRALVFKDGWIDFEATSALYGAMTNANGPGAQATTGSVARPPRHLRHQRRAHRLE